jgi:hypothetical protein
MWEAPPILIARMTTSKWPKWRGAKWKMWRWVAGRKTHPNRSKNRLGQPAWSDRLRPFLPQFAVPFDLAPPRSINRSLLWRSPHPIILPTPFTRKPPPQDEGESWTGRRKEARGGLQAVGLGVFPSFIVVIFIDDVLRSLHHPYVLQSL